MVRAAGGPAGAGRAAGARVDAAVHGDGALYRALGADHVRHRRVASPAVVLRRLLSLDYVLERPAPWLETQTHTAAATAAAASSRVMPEPSSSATPTETPALHLNPVSRQWCKSVRNGSTRPIPCPTLAGMAVGTTRDDG